MTENMQRLRELREQINMTHLSYLETDDNPDKLDQRKKLEGYIFDYLCLVPHGQKFVLHETAELLSRSAQLPDFNACRLAGGWIALARYASNLLTQNWRKEYRTIRLYSGYYKHEVEGSGMANARDMLRAMGYRDEETPDCLTLDGPVCPDQVTAVSRDSLVAYVECQIMIQIWEEVTLDGGSCSWLEVLKCREDFCGDVDQAATTILYLQRNPKDIYSNVKFPGSVATSHSLKNNIYQSPQMGDYMMQPDSYHTVHGQHVDTHYHQPNTNGYIQNGHTMLNDHTMAVKAQMHDNLSMVNNHHDPHNMYCQNPMMQVPHMNNLNSVQRAPLDLNQYRFNYMNMMNQCAPMPGYYYNNMVPQPYMMQPPLTQYGPVRQANTLPLANGYHCPPATQPAYCPTVPTAQLIELDIPSYPHDAYSHHTCPNMSSPKQNNKADKKRLENGQISRDAHLKIHHSGSVDSKNNSNQLAAHSAAKINHENQENARRNSAPRSTASYTSDHNFSIPRSDTQPSLSKAREDGKGTFESWDYVFRNLESQGYSKDLGERGNILSPPLERDSKTLGRVGTRDPKRYQQTTMDLEDGLHAIRLEKDTDEEMYRTAKTNETLLKIKQENEAKAAKAHTRRHILADEKDKRKSSSYDVSTVSPVKDPGEHFKVVNDKVRLISKEDAKDKKDMDKNVYMNGTHTAKVSDGQRRVKKSIVKCLSSETDTNTNTNTNTVRKKSTSDYPAQVASTLKKTPPHVQASASSYIQHTRQPSQGYDSTDGTLKTRLVVTLHDQDQHRSKAAETNGTVRHSAKSNGRDSEYHGKKSTDYQGVSSSKRTEQSVVKTSKEAVGVWECATCTYSNSSSRNSCEMCAKSRQVGTEVAPLMSGGKECPACTLVNKRDATVCTVCDTDLKHSPTYI